MIKIVVIIPMLLLIFFSFYGLQKELRCQIYYYYLSYKEITQMRHDPYTGKPRTNWYCQGPLIVKIISNRFIAQDSRYKIPIQLSLEPIINK